MMSQKYRPCGSWRSQRSRAVAQEEARVGRQTRKEADGGLSLKANMLWNSAGSLTYSGCQWLITVLVVRLSPDYDAAGMLALAMAVSNIFSPIALYKIRAYQVSDVHEETSSGEYVGFRLLTIALAFAGVMVYAAATCAPSALLCVALYLVFRAGESFIDVLHGIDQQHLHMDVCGRSLGARGVLFVIAFSAVLASTGSLELAVLSMSLITYPVIVYDLRQAGRLSSVRPTLTATKALQLLRMCLPAVIGMAVCNFVVTFARQRLSTVMGEAALGVYASVCTPVVLIQACSNYVYSPLLGVFAERLDAGDLRGFRALLARVGVALIVIFAVGAVAFLLAGDWFLGAVFGEGVAAYGWLMYPCILSCALTACVAFLSDLLVAMRQMLWNLAGNLAACLVSLPLSVVLVDACGMNGVSYSIAASYAVGVAIMLARIVWYLRQQGEGARGGR